MFSVDLFGATMPPLVGTIRVVNLEGSRMPWETGTLGMPVQDYTMLMDLGGPI